jgi:hypothetical protein
MGEALETSRPYHAPALSGRKKTKSKTAPFTRSTSKSAPRNSKAWPTRRPLGRPPASRVRELIQRFGVSAWS